MSNSTTWVGMDVQKENIVTVICAPTPAQEVLRDLVRATDCRNSSCVRGDASKENRGKSISLWLGSL